jgi:Arc/MetJ-type ribon-helix-helix transcriptional regulator
MTGRHHPGGWSGGPWRGRGRGGGRPHHSDLPSGAEAAAWLRGRLPEDWYTGPPEIEVDREEITVIGELPVPDGLSAEEAEETERAAAVAGRISRFREDTRERRIEIARQAEHRFGRKLAWGVRLDGSEEVFTNLAVPVMTRLRQPERQVLDTLVDAGVARSRSEALAWAVRLVGEHAESWLTELREAMGAVEDLRSKGPELDGEDG